MSFILDALKKSETDRQEQSSAEFANVPSSDDSPGAPRWLWVLGFLLAINLAVLADQLEEVRERQPATAAAPQTEVAAAVPAPEVPAEQAPAQRRSGFTLKALPTADELRANGTLKMAELHLDIHVYSEVPADRFVFINMVRHQENSRLAEGPVVQEITPEGVILDYSGTEFLLPRE